MCRFVCLAVLCLTLAGCPKTDGANTGPVKTCTKVGEQCLHSPGKMGICGPLEDPTQCQTPQCLTCVSQH
jgi:hypothetical protein